MYFGSIWGILGAALAVPLTGVIKIVLERIPATREFALRLGMISLSQMLTALIECIEAEADAVRVLDVRAIRNACPNVE